jgi:hypothetical protein
MYTIGKKRKCSVVDDLVHLKKKKNIEPTAGTAHMHKEKEEKEARIMRRGIWQMQIRSIRHPQRKVRPSAGKHTIVRLS